MAEEIVQRIKIEPDQAAAQRTAAVLENVIRQVKSTGSEARLLSQGFETVARSVQRVGVSDAALDQLIADETTAAERAARIAKELDGATASARRLGDAGKGGFNLNAARNVAGQAGGLLSQVGAGSAGAAVSSVLGLTSSLGPLGVVAGIATVAAGQLRAEWERDAQAAKEYAERLASNADLVAGGATSGDVQQRIDRLKAGNQVIANQYDELVKLHNALAVLVPDATSESAARLREEASKLAGGKGDSVFAQMQYVFGQVSAITGENVTTMNQFHAVLDAVRLKSGEYTDQIRELERLLRSGELAFNNAVAAAEAVGKAIGDDLTGGLNRFAEAIEAARSANISEVGAQIGRVITGIANAIVAGDIAQSSQTDALLDALQREVEARQKLAEIAAEITRLETEAAGKRAEAAAVRDAAIVEAEAKASDRRIEIAEDTARNVARILRDSGREQLNAIGARDSLAFRQSKIAADDRLEDEQEAAKKQAKQLEKYLGEQQATARKSYETQNRQIEASLKAAETLQRVHAVETNAILENALQGQKTLSIVGANDLYSIHSSMWVSLTSLHTSYAQNLVNSVAAVLNGGVISTPGGAFGNSAAAKQSFARQFDQRYLAYQRIAIP